MRKILGLCMIYVLVLTLSSCQFSTHGELFDDMDKMTQTGDTYSFLAKYETEGEISFRRFSGIYTVKIYSISHDFTLDIDLDIESGQFKCFILMENGDIFMLEEGENIISFDGSRIRLRIMGNDAKGSMTYGIIE